MLLSLSLSDSVFRKAQEGASSYSSLNTNLQIVYLEGPGGRFSLSRIVYLEKPRRVLLLILL